MIDKQQIDELREMRKIPKMEFYTMIGMSSKGYSQMFENGSLKISTLERIAEVLEVPIVYFFEKKSQKPTVEDLQTKVNELYEENRALLKENKQLLQRISVLEKNSTISGNVEFTKLKGK